MAKRIVAPAKKSSPMAKAKKNARKTSSAGLVTVGSRSDRARNGHDGQEGQRHSAGQVQDQGHEVRLFLRQRQGRRRPRRMKDLLGGKGSGLAEMTNAGLPVPPGFTISTDVCTIYYKEQARRSRRHRNARSTTTLRKLEKAAGATLGSTDQPAARLGPLGREVLDARHDGHDPQPRPERRGGRGAEGADRQRPLRLRQLPPLHPDVRQRRARDSEERRSSTSSTAVKTGARREARHRPRRGGAARGGRRATRGSSRSAPARPSRRIRATSCRWRATPCSARG